MLYQITCPSHNPFSRQDPKILKLPCLGQHPHPPPPTWRWPQWLHIWLQIAPVHIEGHRMKPTKPHHLLKAEMKIWGYQVLFSPCHFPVTDPDLHTTFMRRVSIECPELSKGSGISGHIHTRHLAAKKLLDYLYNFCSGNGQVLPWVFMLYFFPKGLVSQVPELLKVLFPPLTYIPTLC